mmetsp:Transcript_9054/g.27250  ORF Transcript_9054/g.27250 Transcript_9054/m.27250 type:complete len:224 (+) Transcript_9054:324-995(+)
MVPDVVRPDGSRDLLRPRRHGLARAEPAAERVRCGGGAGAAAVEDVRRADGRRALLLFRDGRERFAQIRKGGSGHRDLVDVDMRDPLRHPSEPPVRRVLRRVLRRPPPERLEAQRAVLPRRQLNPRPRAVRAAGRRRPGDQRRAPRAYQRREDAPETRFPLIDPSSARLEDQEEPRAQRPVRRDPARQRRLDVAALFSFRSVEERQAGRPRRGLGDRQISPVV